MSWLGIRLGGREGRGLGVGWEGGMYVREGGKEEGRKGGFVEERRKERRRRKRTTRDAD